MEYVIVQEFLKEIEARCAKMGFYGCQSSVNQVAALLPTPDLEGKLTTGQLLDAISSKIQEFDSKNNAPPMLRIVAQYCAEAFGKDLLIEKGLNPDIKPVNAPNQRRPWFDRKKKHLWLKQCQAYPKILSSSIP